MKDEKIRQLLELYSKFLEKWNYMDSDWWSDEPKAIDRFLKEQNKNRKRELLDKYDN